MSVTDMFSSFFEINSFHYPSFSGARNFFKIVSGGMHLSKILTLKKCRKPEVILKILEFANHFPQKTKVNSLN